MIIYFVFTASFVNFTHTDNIKVVDQLSLSNLFFKNKLIESSAFNFQKQDFYLCSDSKREKRKLVKSAVSSLLRARGPNYSQT